MEGKDHSINTTDTSPLGLAAAACEQRTEPTTMVMGSGDAHAIDRKKLIRDIAGCFCRDRIWQKPKGEGPRHVKTALTLAHLNKHLDGTGPAVGLGMIVPGESTTRVAILDFDSHKGETPWPRMVEVARGVADVLRAKGLVPMAFRSSGGSGIHIYYFWSKSQDARSVRVLMTEALDACGLKPGTKGVANGEVEIFPKADRIAEGRAGSMVILPFSGKSCALHSETWEPLP